MRISVTGVNLPGREFTSSDGSPLTNVHVGLQVGRAPVECQPADAAAVNWSIEVEVVDTDGEPDFRGRAVHGRRGERFLYLTWGDVDPAGTFEMFRRAKLMLNRVDAGVMRSAVSSGRLRARVDLTADDGGPRCARIDPPAIEWRAADS